MRVYRWCFWGLRGDAEGEKYGWITLNSPLHQCVCVCVQEEIVSCVRVGELLWGLLWKWRALMSPDYPACLAAEQPHLSVTLTGHLLFIEPLILDIFHLSPLAVEELTERWRQNLETTY